MRESSESRRSMNVTGYEMQPPAQDFRDRNSPFHPMNRKRSKVGMSKSPDYEVQLKRPMDQSFKQNDMSRSDDKQSSSGRMMDPDLSMITANARSTGRYAGGNSHLGDKSMMDGSQNGDHEFPEDD